MNKNPNSLKALNEDDLGKVAGGATSLTITCDACGQRTSDIYYDDETDCVLCSKCGRKKLSRHYE